MEREPVTVVIEPESLSVARWALVERLREDAEVMVGHVDEALTKADGGVAVQDARGWSRLVRDTMSALDALGWPVGDPAPRGSGG